MSESTSEMLDMVDDGAPSIADEHRSPQENADVELKALKRKRQKLEHAIRKTLDSPEGFRVLSFVINDMCGGLARSSALPDFNQGERNVGLRLIELCAKANASRTVQLISEKTNG